MRKKLLALVIALAAVAGVAFALDFTAFKTLCHPAHSNNDDMIVFPGQPGASHKHQYFGNTSVNANSTYGSLIAAPTSCDISADTAGYWIPVLYEGGAELPPKAQKGTAAWYADSGGIDYTFPKNFRMIAGNANATSPIENPAWLATCNWPETGQGADGDPLTCASKADEQPVLLWNCYGRAKSPGGPPVDCRALDGSRHDLWLSFPSCWVGQGGSPTFTRTPGGWAIASPNHRDHVEYPSSAGVCPASHPLRLPRLRVQVTYPPFDGDIMTLAGPGPADKTNAWWTVHFDFVNAWDQAGLVSRTGPTPPEPTGTPTPTPTPTPTCERRC